MLAARKRVHLQYPVTDWIKRYERVANFQFVPLTPAAAALTGSDDLMLHRDPADRFIVATAMEMRCNLITRDEKLQQFHGVTTVW